MKDEEVESVKKSLTKSRKRTPIPKKDFLSTGCTTLNLACSGLIKGGFPKGKYVLFVGDSESGKTWFTMTCLAEAAINPEFDEYRFIHDDSEDGASMDKAAYFGQAVQDRIEPPKGTKDDPVYSSTAEEFYDNLDDAIKDGRPFIYILDSENALEAKDDVDHREKGKKARQSGKEEGGSYGTAKPKVHSRYLRAYRNKLRKNGSILIIISQTRSNIGLGAQFEPKTRSGGHALRFFADLEIWSSVVERVKKKVGQKNLQVGMTIQLRMKKNRITGKKRTVEARFYDEYGIDDLWTCIDYLIAWGHWRGTKEKVVAPEFGYSGLKTKLIRKIEDEGLEGELRNLVGEVWRTVEDGLAVKRKPRYT